MEEAQKRFEELMARAAAGEEILVGEGERIAKLVPIAHKHSEIQKTSAVPDVFAPDATGEGDR